MIINLIIFFACYYSWGIEPSLPLLQLKKVVLYTYSRTHTLSPGIRNLCLRLYLSYTLVQSDL